MFPAAVPRANHPLQTTGNLLFHKAEVKTTQLSQTSTFIFKSVQENCQMYKDTHQTLHITDGI